LILFELIKCFELVLCCYSRSLAAGGSEGDRLRGLVERGGNKPFEAGAEVGAVGQEHPPELPPRLQGTAGSRPAGSDTPGLRLSSNSNFELCTSHPELEQGWISVSCHRFCCRKFSSQDIFLESKPIQIFM
jgi:hypothetical protein